MMHAIYESTVDRLFAAAHAQAEELPHTKAASVNPLSMSGPRGNVFDQGGGENRSEEEQYKHFRGQVYSSAMVIINRVAGQPLYVGRVKRGKKSGKAKTLKAYYDSGAMKAAQSPSFVKSLDASNLEILEEHEIHKTLGNPNDLMVGHTLWFHTVANLRITGKSYWLLDEETITRPGKPAETRKTVTPLPSTWVWRNKAGDGWLVRPPGSTATPIPVKSDKMAYFYLPDPSNPWGALSPIEVQARAILADESIQKAQQVAFDNGIFPAVALIAGEVETSDGMQQLKLEKHQRRELMQWMRNEYMGAMKFGLPVILDALIKDVKVLSNTPQQMAFMESGDYTKSRIYEGQGVNPLSAGQVEGANRASSAVADGHLCSNAVNPLIELISQVMTQWLGPWFAKPGETLKVWLAAAEANDPEILLKRWELAMQYYKVTDDEFRAAILGLPELPNGEGKKVRRPVTLVAEDEMDDARESQNQPPPAEPEADPEEDDPEEDETDDEATATD